VLAGLPGAGKTRPLRRLHDARPPGVRALDAEEVAARLRRDLPRVPYRMHRHVVRAARLRTLLERTGVLSFVDDVLVVPRAVAGRTDRLVVGPGRLSLRPPRRCAA
jgi:hypothetical protein